MAVKSIPRSMPLRASIEPSELTEPKNVWLKRVKTVAHERLFWHMVYGSLEALTKAQYTKFDALTTSNCCHGIATLAYRLIKSIDPEEVKTYHAKSRVNKDEPKGAAIKCVSNKIIALASLYLLNEVADVSEGKGRRTVTKKLRKIVFKIGSHFSDKIVSDLQKCFSNLVAHSYAKYASLLDSSKVIHGASLKIWGKYVSIKYLRLDRRKVTYALCIFSMQITLAYLSSINAKIAVMNDVYSSGEKCSRHITVLKSFDQHQFFPVNHSELNKDESVVVFAGFSKANSNQDLDYWLDGKFSKLCLANDIHYPQFPKVRNDPNFDSSPMQPIEFDQVFEECKRIKGVSVQDPSLFVLSHVFLVSAKEIGEHCSSIPSMVYTPSNLLSS